MAVEISLVQDAVEAHTIDEVYLSNHDVVQQSNLLLGDVFQPKETNISA